jgi:hypothetical protein
MDVTNYKNWIKRSRYEVYRTPSGDFYNASNGVYQAFPYHRLISPSADEVSELFKVRKAIAVRYCTPYEAHNRGRVSYHAVFEHKNFQLSNLSRKARKDVRRGNRNCIVRKI